MIFNFLPLPAFASSALFTSTPHIIKNYTVSSSYFPIGKNFNYETGFGKVAVESNAIQTAAQIRILPNSEIKIEYINFTVDSFFADSQIGNSKFYVKLFSSKTTFPFRQQIKPHNFKFGFGYKFLNSNVASDIHFLDFFGTTSLGTVEATGGLTTSFGNEIDSELGGFASLSYIIGKSFNFFTEYNSLDYMKVIQNQIIAKAAQNVGTIITTSVPKDALSAGFNLVLDKRLNFKFALYDLALQRKPFIELSFLR